MIVWHRPHSHASYHPVFSTYSIFTLFIHRLPPYEKELYCVHGDCSVSCESYNFDPLIKLTPYGYSSGRGQYGREQHAHILYVGGEIRQGGRDESLLVVSKLAQRVDRFHAIGLIINISICNKQCRELDIPQAQPWRRRSRYRPGQAPS